MAICVYGCLERAKVQRDDFTVIYGLGPIGLFTLIALRDHGVKRIVAVAPTRRGRDRLQLAEELGADRVIAAEENVPQRILQETGGEKVDCVVECRARSRQLMKESGSWVKTANLWLWGSPPGQRDARLQHCAIERDPPHLLLHFLASPLANHAGDYAAPSCGTEKGHHPPISVGTVGVCLSGPRAASSDQVPLAHCGGKDAFRWFPNMKHLRGKILTLAAKAIHKGAGSCW